MNPQASEPTPAQPAEFPQTESGRASATGALSTAFHDSLDLLFKPLDAGQWLRLALVCLFLGGGLPSAAFNWTLGFLPGDLGLFQFFDRVREYVATHLWLILVWGALGLGLALVLLYLRSVFRLVLVDAILKRQARLREAWRRVRPLGRSYYRWLLGVLALFSVVLVAGAFTSYAYFRSAAASGVHGLGFWVTLASILLIDSLLGLVLALLVVLTDDLVVPLMYAESLPLPAAWRVLWNEMRADPGPFGVYILVRFGVSLGTSVFVLFLLFPILLGLFSGAIISGALLVLVLHLAGWAWNWNALTFTVAATGVILLLSLILMVLSVVAMPAQVFLQNFGIHFIAARAPSLGRLPKTRTRGQETGG